MIKEMPEVDRPRERLIYHGAEHLATHELLAILLRTGSKQESVLDLAKRVLQVVEELETLNEMTVHELMAIKGIGMAKAVEILAAIELGSRIKQASGTKKKVTTPEDVYKLVKDELIHKDQEYLIAIYLNVKSEVIMKKTIYIGTINATIIHPREIFKWAYKYSSFAIILCHNHPTGDPTPSNEDIEMTKKLMAVGETMGIKVIDHVVVAKKGYYSIGNRRHL
ncbi:MAG TPA: DNA repair protein RadC [Bacilli bacterium]|nr:DNA repair protein RadC [Bacilli bacterium]